MRPFRVEPRLQSWPALLRKQQQTHQEAAEGWDMQGIYGDAGDLNRTITNDRGIYEGATATCLRKVVAKMVQLETRGHIKL